MPADVVAVLGVAAWVTSEFNSQASLVIRSRLWGAVGERDAAKKLGATVYIDNKATNAAEELQKLGGAQAILATAPSSKAMSEVIDAWRQTASSWWWARIWSPSASHLSSS